MNRNQSFNICWFLGILAGICVELINYFNGNVVGIGLIIYLLVMITFYQIFGRKK